MSCFHDKEIIRAKKKVILFPKRVQKKIALTEFKGT